MMSLSKKDMRFISLAIDASKKSNMLMKHGCVISLNGKFISSGFNTYRNRFNNSLFHSSNKPSCSCHAEMDALYKATKKVSFKRKKRLVQCSSKVANSSKVASSSKVANSSKVYNFFKNKYEFEY